MSLSDHEEMRFGVEIVGIDQGYSIGTRSKADRQKKNSPRQPTPFQLTSSLEAYVATYYIGFLVMSFSRLAFDNRSLLNREILRFYLVCIT